MMERSERRRRPPADAELKKDLRLQEGIFLVTFALMLLLLISLYTAISPILSAVVAVALLLSTLTAYVKWKDFLRLRDRGQRTWCVIVSLYASLLLTLICAYFYMLREPLTMEYAVAFLFGFLFFTFMAYRSLSPHMVIGNIRRRPGR